jgi:hypothetical protein
MVELNCVPTLWLRSARTPSTFSLDMGTVQCMPTWSGTGSSCGSGCCWYADDCPRGQGRGSLYRTSSSMTALHMGQVGCRPCLHQHSPTLAVPGTNCV